uniref:Uncharacterized protein n=1 Tax=Glossina austeni TaxID=7395 RepID=A0A1A9V5Q1_GLOAU
MVGHVQLLANKNDRFSERTSSFEYLEKWLRFAKGRFLPYFSEKDNLKRTGSSPNIQTTYIVILSFVITFLRCCNSYFNATRLEPWAYCQQQILSELPQNANVPNDHLQIRLEYVLLLLLLQEGDNYKARFGEIKCTRSTDNRSTSGTPALPTSGRKPVSDEGICIWTSAFVDGRQATLCVSQTLVA